MQAFKSPITTSRFISGFTRSSRNFSTSPISRFTASSLKMGVTEIKTADEYKTKVTEYEGPVVVDFFATWCGPCKAIAPAVEKLSEATPNVNFYKVDVDVLAEVAADNGISAMPTFKFRNGGKDVETVKGANPGAIQAGLQAIAV